MELYKYWGPITLAVVVFGAGIYVQREYEWWPIDDGGQSCAAMVQELGGTFSMREKLAQPKPTAFQDKLDDFADYKGSNAGVFSFTQATELTDIERLENTVMLNMEAFGEARQLYNYVITPDCNIIVAEWTESAADQDFTQSLPTTCPGGREEFEPVKNAGTMVNFFQEDLGSQFQDMLAKKVDKRDRQSPCWQEGVELITGADEKNDTRDGSLLDALSKHFMLAQEETGTIEEFDANEWPDTMVAFAGEILIDPQACTFILNGGSGTYLPERTLAPTVTVFFANKLNDGSQKLSGIGGCPPD